MNNGVVMQCDAPELPLGHCSLRVRFTYSNQALREGLFPLPAAAITCTNDLFSLQ